MKEGERYKEKEKKLKKKNERKKGKLWQNETKKI